MIKQVIAVMYFDIEDEAWDFFHDCELAMDKATFINGGSPNEEFSFAKLVNNHHDEDPNGSCDMISELDNKPPD